MSLIEISLFCLWLFIIQSEVQSSLRDSAVLPAGLFCWSLAWIGNDVIPDSKYSTLFAQHFYPFFCKFNIGIGRKWRGKRTGEDKKELRGDCWEDGRELTPVNEDYGKFSNFELPLKKVSTNCKKVVNFHKGFHFGKSAFHFYLIPIRSQVSPVWR